MMMLQDKELKNIIGDIVNKLVNFFKMDAIKIHLDNFLTNQYTKGLEASEVKFNMNFTPSDDISFLKDYAMQNVNETADQISKDLRKEISRSILNKETKEQLVGKIKNMFNDKKYSNRMKMILRTEGLRSGNLATFDAAHQTGFEVKKWADVIMDDVTSNICKQEHKKYGSPEKAIPLDDDFIVTVKVGSKVKTIRTKTFPAHPNCRTVLRLERVE